VEDGAALFSCRRRICRVARGGADALRRRDVRRDAEAFGTRGIAVFTPAAYVAGAQLANLLDRRDIEYRMRAVNALLPSIREYSRTHGSYPEQITMPSALRFAFPPATEGFLSPVRYRRLDVDRAELAFSDGWYEYYFDTAAGRWQSRD
jgi:hypothetical protein